MKPTVTVAMGEEGDRVIHLDEPDGFLRIKVSETGSAGHKRALYHAIERIAELEAERDALAAHVKELRKWIMRSVECKEGCPGSWDEDCNCGKGNILRQFPQTSLAQRDARMKAEALDEVWKYLSAGAAKGEVVSKQLMMMHLFDRAAEYRQQAEGE